jgi:hypothetical protein
MSPGSGLDRREFLRRVAQTGVATAWAAPILTTIASPAAFAQTYGKDFSYVALCYTCNAGATRCCVKFDLNDDGTPVLPCEKDNFETPGCPGFTFDDNDNDCGDCSKVLVTPTATAATTILVTLTDPSCKFVEGQGVGKCGNPPTTGECVEAAFSADLTSAMFEMCGV